MNKGKTNKEFVKEVYNLVGDEYEFLEEYVGSRTKIKCRHNCGNEYQIRPDSFLRGARCPKCSVILRTKTNEKFKEEVYNLTKNEYDFLEEYINSQTKIKCRHNTCGHTWWIKPNDFLKGRRCPKCFEESKRKTNTEFIAEVFDLVGNEYSFLEEYIGSKTKIKCKHNNCGYIWKIDANSFLNGARCPECQQKLGIAKIRKTNDVFIDEVYSLVGNEYIFLEEYVNNSMEIKCIHSTCGHEWYVTPLRFLHSSSRCPECFGTPKTNKRFVKEVFDLVGDEYMFLEEYVSSSTKIQCKHNECGYEWKTTPSHFLQGKRCPQCNESKGEQAIRGYLTSINIKFCREYSFDNLLSKNNNPLRFDFAIFNKNNDLIKLIEYDGEQHYEPVDFFGKGEKYANEQFEILKMHDNYKNEYCINNKIPLLRISYMDFDNIENILSQWIKNTN